MGAVTHAEELGGEDTLEFDCLAAPSKGVRVVWVDPEDGAWREHEVMRTDADLGRQRLQGRRGRRADGPCGRRPQVACGRAVRRRRAEDLQLRGRRARARGAGGGHVLLQREVQRHPVQPVGSLNKQVRHVVIEGDVDAGAGPCTSCWFYGCSALEQVDGMRALLGVV